ncbi:hypothetical protein JF110_001633 [Campylobacter jejuni]|nr:hypothetical protein [Campylobacter jejuni]
MELKTHQKIASAKAKKILVKHNLVYIFGYPRIGKSLIALETCKEYKKILVLTKKNAIEGWLKYRDTYSNYEVYNYEKISKLNNNDYDIVIIDEAHNFGTTPKPSVRIKTTKEFCKNKPLVYLSGTPLVESPLKIYPQFSLSSFSPFSNFKNFYDFFRYYGIPDTICLFGRILESYTKCKDSLLKDIKKYIVKVTYDDAGFNYDNRDSLVYIKPNAKWLKLFNTIKKDCILSDYPLESASAVYQALHQYEGGTYKDHVFKNKPKIDWLINLSSNNIGKKIAVMSYFVGERKYLNSLGLVNVDIYSSTKNCEGVDLSHYDIFILYSFGYSGSKFIQLRDRIVNINKSSTSYCLIPMISGGIVEKIYKCVSNKKDFNSNIFRKELNG